MGGKLYIHPPKPSLHDPTYSHNLAWLACRKYYDLLNENVCAPDGRTLPGVLERTNEGLLSSGKEYDLPIFWFPMIRQNRRMKDHHGRGRGGRGGGHGGHGGDPHRRSHGLLSLSAGSCS